MRASFAIMWMLVTGGALPVATASASEPSPRVVAEFTRRVQPLLFNRCAGGGCHGGPDAGSLHLVRSDFTGHITHEITLANIEAILAACGSQRSPAALIATISDRHPTSATTPRELAPPLSPRERKILEDWLNTAVTVATFGPTTVSASQPRNRLQKLLDEAAHPPVLPPPQEPPGVILK